MRARLLTALFLVTSLSVVAGCDDTTSAERDASAATQEVFDAALTDSEHTDAATSFDSSTADANIAATTLELDTLVFVIPAGALNDNLVVTLHHNEQGSEVPSDAYSKRYDIEPQELTLELEATLELEISGAPLYPVLVLHTPGQSVRLIQGQVTDGVFSAGLDRLGSVYLADAAELAQSAEFADHALVVELVGQGAADAGPSLDAQAPDGLTDAGAATTDVGSSSSEPESSSASSDSDADAATTAPIEPGVVPPRGYLDATSSPFAGVTFDYFYLEDFEDHELNQLGVTASAYQMSSTFGSAVVDSVDGDDGNPSDNQCVKLDAYCDSLWASGTVTFTFDPEALGGYPTHAGAVWTDGEGMVGFEAFGPEGEVIYVVEPFSEEGFPGVGVTSDTAEDRFFGVYSPQGVSAIRLYNTAGGIEVDHLQYGQANTETITADALTPQ